MRRKTLFQTLYIYELWYNFPFIYIFTMKIATVNTFHTKLECGRVSVCLFQPRPRGPELPEMEKRPKEMEKIKTDRWGKRHLGDENISNLSCT